MENELLPWISLAVSALVAIFAAWTKLSEAGQNAETARMGLLQEDNQNLRETLRDVTASRDNIMKDYLTSQERVAQLELQNELLKAQNVEIVEERDKLQVEVREVRFKLVELQQKYDTLYELVKGKLDGLKQSSS